MEKALRANRSRLYDKVDTNTSVLEYVYDTPERSAEPVHVLGMVKEIMSIRSKNLHVSEGEFVVMMRKESFADTLSRTHPTIFKLACDTKKNAQHIEVLARMMRIQGNINHDFTSDHAKVHVQQMLLSQFSRPLTDEEKKDMEDKKGMEENKGMQASSEDK
jgi:hypothetical protein